MCRSLNHVSKSYFRILGVSCSTRNREPFPSPSRGLCILCLSNWFWILLYYMTVDPTGITEEWIPPSKVLCIQLRLLVSVLFTVTLYIITAVKYSTLNAILRRSPCVSIFQLSQQAVTLHIGFFQPSCRKMEPWIPVSGLRSLQDDKLKGKWAVLVQSQLVVGLCETISLRFTFFFWNCQGFLSFF